ncbi:MAG: non-ribosomal peptide synthetase, partial [Candidatus Limivicinus sp.]
SLPAAEAFDAGIQPDDLFVLLYTSGTTGTPKGAMILHHNVAELAAWTHDYYHMDETARHAAYASYGFDANLLDTYPPLTCGGALYIIPDEIRLDLNAIASYIDENGITTSVMTTQVGRQFALAYGGGSLKDLIVGGETLVPIDPRKVHFTLHNAYGPSECTVLATIQPVDRLYHRIPIGKALENVKLYVVDQKLRRLPLFAPGELLIAGPHVAGGYLNLPEKTDACFLRNPFSDEAGYERVYRTGDVVRMLPDGRIDFIGRHDSQVKVRGFRIELPEVEGVIREYPGIRDATVQAFADEETGMKYLAAYVVSDQHIDVASLNAFIRERKPPYMVPAVTMQLDAIPLTQNNKVNKKALPLPRREAADHEQPATEAEQLAFDCAAEALGHRDFGVTTDLEEAGLSSLGAMQLNVLLSKAFHRTVRMSDMRPLRTVRDVAAFFQSSSQEQHYALQKSYPLSTVQQGIYVECLAKPDSTAYNLPFLLRLDPSVELPRLKAALTETVNAHPYLKTRLKAAPRGEIAAIRDDSAEIEIPVLDKKDLRPDFSDLVRPFCLTEEPLLRVALIPDEPSSYLFVDAHHLIFDGESLLVFLRDLEQAYAGTAPEKESFTGFEFALDEQQLRKTTAYEEAK